MKIEKILKERSHFVFCIKVVLVYDKCKHYIILNARSEIPTPVN